MVRLVILLAPAETRKPNEFAAPRRSAGSGLFEKNGIDAEILYLQTTLG